MARLSVPTKARLPSSLRVNSTNAAVLKCLTRLSRESLISLALNWLDDSCLQNAFPYLKPDVGEEADDYQDEDMDDLYPPARSIDELRQFYDDLRYQKGSKRDVVSRVLEGDWRHGLTLYQLATADFSYLDEHPTSQRWSAYQILPLKHPSNTADEEDIVRVDKESLQIPRLHPSTFLQNLQNQVLPDVKAHYHFYRPEDFPVLLLRIFVIDSPYNSSLALSGADQTGTASNFDTSRTVYLAFPDGSPALYITKTQGTGSTSAGESRSLQNLIVDGVPKALSRPRERYTVKSTNLSSRNLSALLDRKGPGRTNYAGGGWSVYTDEKKKQSPLDSILPTPPLSRESSDSARDYLKRRGTLTQAERDSKRAKIIADARFGTSAVLDDGKGVEKFEVVLQDPFPAASDAGDLHDDDDDADAGGTSRRSKVDALLQQAEKDLDIDDMDLDVEQPTQWTPNVKITLNGPHVFAGIRQLVEAGIIDGQRMPGWLTGEEGVTAGAIKHGRVKGHKGSGM